MVFQALANAGVPYRRGGDSRENGFDCSGLVAHVYKEAFGIQLRTMPKRKAGWANR